MKRVKFFLILLFIFLGVVHPALVDIYKRGVVTLIEDPNYGKGNDWVSLFYDEQKSIALAPDGSVFVSNSNQHNIYKFGADGKYLSRFSQLGNGPGDSFYPDLTSILDGKYMVVGEYAANRKISLFDFTGKIYKVIKTNRSVFYPIALKNNKIAYFFYDDRPIKKLVTDGITNVVIKDILSGEEKIIDKFERIQRIALNKSGKGGFGFGPEVNGDVLIRKTKDGNLMIGATMTPEIKIYSPEGKLIQVFKLSLVRQRVTDEFIKFSKEKFIKEFEEMVTRERFSSELIKQLKSVSFDSLVGDYLPYYSDLTIDSDGNLLVFPNRYCKGGCNPKIQVYSQMGQHLCDFTIDESKTRYTSLSPATGKQRYIFTEKAIYAIVKRTDTDDIEIHLVKYNLK